MILLQATEQVVITDFNKTGKEFKSLIVLAAGRK